MTDPFLILGVPTHTDDASVESAYLEGIRQCPPDRDPEGFKALREAYEKIRTQRDRIAFDLFDATPPSPSDILEKAAPTGAPHRPALQTLQALLRGEP